MSCRRPWAPGRCCIGALWRELRFPGGRNVRLVGLEQCLTAASSSSSPGSSVPIPSIRFVPFPPDFYTTMPAFENSMCCVSRLAHWCLSPTPLREGENKKIHVGPLLPQSMPPKRKAKRDGGSVLRKFFDEAMQIRSPLPPELIRARIPLIGLCGVGCRDAGARRARAS